MFSDFVKNEIYMSCEYIKSHSVFFSKGIVVNIIGEHILCDYIKNTLAYLNNKTEYKCIQYQHKSSDTLSSTVLRQCFLYCFDARKGTSQLDDLKKALDYAKNFADAQFLCMTIIPNLEKRYDTQALAEMELSNALSGSPLTEVEKLLSSYLNKLCIKQIRFDNFIIEDCDENPLNISDITNKALKNGSVTIDSNDAFLTASAISMSDAVNAVFTVLKNGKHANVYNASGESMSLYDLKSFVYKALCPYGISLNFNSSKTLSKNSYMVLSSGKLQSLGFSYLCDNHTRLLYAMSDLVSDKYNIIADKTNSLYDGKLSYIRKMELELLQQVDMICKQHGIKYFLSGGTMLGAVRHKGFIPWDDDIDIAMLREDFEIFKSVCKEKLSDKYQYQTFENKDGYHYFFDKITIKDTYFATKYSDDYDMLKGISMDIFVFDKTSDNKFFQKLHYKSLMMLRLLMNVRWKNYARKDKGYALSKILLPLLRLFSMDTYSKWYDQLLRKYEHKQTSTVLPPATDHKWRGVMPKNWFENVTDAPFENVMSYIPTGYDKYLKQWYGDDYMELLPLCKRVGSHDFYRLDIGNEIKADINADFKHYNYKGELL